MSKCESKQRQTPESADVANHNLPSLLTVQELAAVSRRAPKSIRNAASLARQGKRTDAFPRPRKVGGLVLFDRAEVLCWLEGSAKVEERG